jgi:WXG100 family type VII secretion target
MPSPTVRANYDELKTIQQTFNQQADAVAKTNQALKARMETLKSGDWIGKGATAFYQEMDGQVMPSMNRLQRALAEASRITAQIAQLMKQAEDEASGVLHI